MQTILQTWLNPINLGTPVPVRWHLAAIPHRAQLKDK